MRLKRRLNYIDEKINELEIALHAQKQQGIEYDKVEVTRLISELDDWKKHKSEFSKEINEES